MSLDSKKNAALWLLALLGAFALCLVAARLTGPLGTPFGMPCLFHKLTGLYCPGCGATRGFRLLSRLDLLGALRQNLFVFGLVPPLLGFLFFQAFSGVPKLGPRAFQAILFVFLALALLFAVLRNIPSEPFSLLAPR